MDQHVLELVRLFQTDPLDFFHEREIHSTFFNLSRTTSGVARTKDGYTIHLLRQEYNTLWRYRGSRPDGFAERLDREGDVGEMDFAILRPAFVQANDYLTVMNKEEPLRCKLRRDPWPQADESPMLASALEFKMAHVHPVGPRPRGQGVRLGDFDVEGIRLDCRKLACERPSTAYLVALTHTTYQDWFSLGKVTNLIRSCLQEWSACYDGPEGSTENRLRILVASPSQCFRWGNWVVAFPQETQIQL